MEMDTLYPILKKMRENNFQELYDAGFRYEAEIRGCSQCITAAFVEVCGLDPILFKISSGLAAGGGLTCQGDCGAFTGGQMVISFLLGRSYDDKENYPQFRYSCAVVRNFREKFIEEYGTTVCSEIHKKLYGRTFDILDPDDYIAFDEAGAHTIVAPALVGNAARMVAQALIEEYEKANQQ